MPLNPVSSDPDEQSEAERLATARRYRQSRTKELFDLVRPHLSSEPVAVGEFSSRPIESLLTIPIVGMFVALWYRARSKHGLPAEMLLALDDSTLHLLAFKHGRMSAERAELEPRQSWPRDSVHVSSIRRKFSREEVTFEPGDDDPLILYTIELTSNPWSAKLVRELGGEAPEPRDLGEPA